MNPNFRGELEIVIEGRRMVIRPSLATTFHVEEKMGLHVAEMAKKYGAMAKEKKPIPTKDCFMLMWFCVLDERPTLTFEQFCKEVWKKVDMIEVYKMAGAIIDALIRCGKEGEKDPGEAQPPATVEAPATK